MASTTETPKIKLYWLEQSRSQRILWLLEELNLPYELEIFHRDPVSHLAPPELKKVHALGKSPVISITTTDNKEPLIIAESAFIIEYLLDHFSQGTTLLPKRYKEGQEGKVGGETEEWMRFRYFMHYAEGSLMTLMLVAVITNGIKTAPVPFFIKPITSMVAGKVNATLVDPGLKTHFEFLEGQLKSSPSNGKYLCGPNLTGADFLMSFPLIAGRKRAGVTETSHPAVYAYTERLKKEPGYVKGVEKIISIEGKFEESI